MEITIDVKETNPLQLRYWNQFDHVKQTLFERSIENEITVLLSSAVPKILQNELQNELKEARITFVQLNEPQVRFVEINMFAPHPRW